MQVILLSTGQLVRPSKHTKIHGVMVTHIEKATITGSLPATPTVTEVHALLLNPAHIVAHWTE